MSVNNDYDESCMDIEVLKEHYKNYTYFELIHGINNDMEIIVDNEVNNATLNYNNRYNKNNFNDIFSFLSTVDCKSKDEIADLLNDNIPIGFYFTFSKTCCNCHNNFNIKITINGHKNIKITKKVISKWKVLKSMKHKRRRNFQEMLPVTNIRQFSQFPS